MKPGWVGSGCGLVRSPYGVGVERGESGRMVRHKRWTLGRQAGREGMVRDGGRGFARVTDMTGLISAAVAWCSPQTLSMLRPAPDDLPRPNQLPCPSHAA